MSTNASGCERSEGHGEGATIIGDPMQALLELALQADARSSAWIGPVARELFAQLDPQDSAEKMLITQMIATFSRSMFLSRNANIQKNQKWFALYSSECDRTMDLYRKQMQTLIEYRRPRRRMFTAIRTANIVGQQVVVGDSAPAGSVGGACADRKGDRAERVESAPRIEE